MPTEEGRGNEEGSKIHSTMCSYVSPRSTEPVVVLDKQRDIKQIKVCFILHTVALLLVLLLLRAGLVAALPWMCGPAWQLLTHLHQQAEGHSATYRARC